ncbi:MAG: hypothetical protein WDN66_00300 [Candidatus Saccharibacteria bacterium]
MSKFEVLGDSGPQIPPSWGQAAPDVPAEVAAFEDLSEGQALADSMLMDADARQNYRAEVDKKLSEQQAAELMAGRFYQKGMTELGTFMHGDDWAKKMYIAV